MRKKRHNYKPQEKVAILKRHLVEHVPVSNLCDEYQLQPTVFYDWQKQFFENGDPPSFEIAAVRSALRSSASNSLKRNYAARMKCSRN